MEGIVVNADIVNSLLTLTGVMLTGFVTIMVAVVQTFRHTRKINDAVNGRHPDKPKCLDMIVELHERIGAIDLIIKQCADWKKDNDGWNAKHDKVHDEIKAKLNEYGNR